ncbi:hypothetical protein NDU88_000613 [Pleurodeles waltl]|uniref:Uncharacterized protein n=1 Tax=Pleurodeles waltl TaxID=8319 RepID=A0AAV7MHC6_PLEWA|nr:hypothetical protein NDU88_000613 [Pleurodeles waltl]
MQGEGATLGRTPVPPGTGCPRALRRRREVPGWTVGLPCGQLPPGRRHSPSLEAGGVHALCGTFCALNCPAFETVTGTRCKVKYT